MMVLLFHAGDQRYALDVHHVSQVLPLVQLRSVPGTPRWLTGVFSCRGELTAAIDVTQLLTSQPAVRRLSTRMLTIDQPQPAHAAPNPVRKLALIVEHLTEVRRLEQTRAGAVLPMNVANASHLGPLLQDEEGPVQLIEPVNLLPPELAMLLADAAEVAPP